MGMGGDGRVLVVGLDGLEISYAEQLMDAGELPHLAALRRRSAAFLLANPPERRTGLEWEEFASGLTPERFGRDSPIIFDPDAYTVVQDGVQHEPFLGRLAARTVVFDAPYCDLERAPSLRGVVAWGAHDPGIVATARPPSLVDALEPYPASQAIYALPWPSVDRCRAMGEDLVAGAEARADAAVRLMTEVTPDWEVFTVVSGELHSAIEALWHGASPGHPLHGHPSAPVARAALDATHRAVDDLLGRVLDAAGPDAHVVAFNLGGMGDNVSDVPTMVLLPELLHRWAYGAPLLRPRADWAAAPGGVPILDPEEGWERAVLGQLPAQGRGRRLVELSRRLPGPLREGLHRLRGMVPTRPGPATAPWPVDWMPAARYADRWPGMDAFALPAYYQGRIRVNLEGRERHGRVALADLDATLDDLEQLLRECRDPQTGEGVVAGFERPRAADPLDVPSDHADLVVIWQGTANAFEHPEHGRIGPVPHRRTGGHTGPHGVCFVAGPGIEPHDYELRSAFDVAPTVVALAGSGDADGRSLVPVPDPVG